MRLKKEIAGGGAGRGPAAEGSPKEEGIMSIFSRDALVVLAIVAMAVSQPVCAGPAGDGSAARQANEGPVRVFILAGQSNMEGHGGIRTLDELGAHPTQGQLLKKIKNDDGSFVVRDDVFIYYQRGREAIKEPLTVGQGAGRDRIGPELMFGIEMGDYFEEPVLLIKTAWGGKDLYCDFRPPSAGKPAYDIPGQPRELGASYRKMVEEIHQCLDHLDTRFPQLKGRHYEICGFVWFQGWNDMCADRKIKQQVFDEYARNFVHLVQDLRAEFKVPRLPVVVGEVGVGGDEKVSPDMAGLRAAQAKVATQPELSGTLRYVRTAPYWYPALDEWPRRLHAEEQRVRQRVAAQVKQSLEGKPEASDPKKVEQLVNAALSEARQKDEQYRAVLRQHDQVISHWECHYWGSARVYCLVGHGLAEAMKERVQAK
jgi:alpha-galactosidase